MSNLVRTCPDGHRCENGSRCVEDPNDEGSYACDCATAEGDFAGRYCEFQAETHCEFKQEVSSSWFCTNRGTCVLKVDDNSAEYTCDCPDDYTGKHCEFVATAYSGDWPDADQLNNSKGRSGGGSSLEGGVIAAIVLVVLIVVSLMVLVVWKTKRGGSGGKAQTFSARALGLKTPTANTDPSEALRIDADGQVLQHAIQSLRTPGTHEYDFESPDEPYRDAPEDETEDYDQRGTDDDDDENEGHGTII